MKIVKEATDEAILSELGGRFARMRLEKNLTQAQLAERAGVSKRTVERLERGDVAPQMSGFIRVCRALELVERFELLVPEPVMSPMLQLRLGGKRRRRASTRAVAEYPTPVGSGAGVVNEAAPVAAAPVAWTWGDDQ